MPVFPVGQNSPNDVLGVAVVSEYLGPVGRMVFGGGADLPVKVVEQSGDGPLLFIACELAGVTPHGGLNGEQMLHQHLRLDVCLQKF